MKISKIIKVLTAVLVFCCVAFSWQHAVSYSTYPPLGYTGAPSESNCTGCHTGTAYSSTSMAMTMNSGSTLQYMPDTTYKMEITFTSSGIKKWGFELTDLDGSNKATGTLTATATGTAKSTFNSRQYIFQSSTITSSGSITIDFQWQAPNPGVGDVTFYVAINATNNDNSDGGDKIYLQSFTIKEVSPKIPVASISYSPTSLCAGDTATLTASGTNSPSSYSWTFKNANISSSSSQKVKVVFGTTGTATLTATNSYGTSVAVTKTVKINPLPVDTIFFSRSPILCQGDSVTLTGPSGATWLWSNGDKNQSITVKKAGSYSVTTTGTGGCVTKGKAVKVVVNPAATASLLRNAYKDTLCGGDTLKFTATPSMSKYVFYKNNAVYKTQTSNLLSVTGLTGTSQWSVVVYNSSGCKDSLTPIIITVRSKLAKPTLTAGTSTSSTVTASWNAISGALGYEVSVDSGKTWITPSTGATGTSHTQSGFSFSQSLNLLVRGTNHTACNKGNIGSIILTTISCSNITYTIAHDTLVCEGASANVAFSNFSTNNYTVQPKGGTASTKTSYSYKPTQDTLITFYLMDNNKPSCPAAPVYIPIKVDKTPDVTLTADKKSYCEGDAVHIDAIPGYKSYKFFRNKAIAATQSSNSFTYTGLSTGDQISVAGYTAAGCNKTSNVITLNFNAKPIPTFVVSKNKLVATFTNSTSGYASCVWDFGDGKKDTLQSPQHTFTASGTYKVLLSVKNLSGCMDTASQTVTVNSNSSIKNEDFLQTLSVQPVPFTDMLNVSFSSAKPCILQITLSDINGRPVAHYGPSMVTIGKNELHIPASQIKAGTYVLHLTDGTSQMNMQVLKN